MKQLILGVLVILSMESNAQSAPITKKIKDYIIKNPDKSIGCSPSDGKVYGYSSVATGRSENGNTRLEFQNLELIDVVTPLETSLPCGGPGFGFSANCFPGLVNSVSGSSGPKVVECLPLSGICFMTNVVFDPNLVFMW